MTKTTKQGVRNLDSSGAAVKKHVHRYAPHTFVTRNGTQATQMKCFCGDVPNDDDGAPDQTTHSRALEVTWENYDG